MEYHSSCSDEVQFVTGNMWGPLHWRCVPGWSPGNAHEERKGLWGTLRGVTYGHRRDGTEILVGTVLRWSLRRTGDKYRV